MKSLEGVLTFNWVHFDEAHTDAEGDSGYMQAEINECYLQKHAQISPIDGQRVRIGVQVQHVCHSSLR